MQALQLELEEQAASVGLLEGGDVETGRPSMVQTRSSARQDGHQQQAAEGEHPGDRIWHKGVAISMWQNSGDETSNWTHFVKSKLPFRRCPIGFNRFSGKYSIVDNVPNTWDKYRQDIELAKEVGCNAFRLSIEWSRIEPRRGHIDEAAVQRYHELLDCLEEHGIEPNATCHHFTHPEWFDEIGGFERQENIALFVQYCAKCVELFGHRIRYWATFNEPTCATFLGWITGMHPPGKILHCVKAGHVLLHKLCAHVAAYRAMKAAPNGDRVLVGLVHHHITFLATGPRLLRAFASYAAQWMDYWWGYDLVHHWMMTGEFTWKVPLLGEWLRYQDPNGKPPCDWFGVNYYSRSVVTWYLKPWCLPGEIMTDMYYPIYAEGLYKALMRARHYAVPLYVTETGIADRRDAHRAVMIDEYMRATLRAMADGADVRGLYYWTLLDNFEWNAGYIMEFGLYAWRPDGSVDRKLKEGAKMLVRYFKTLPEGLDEVRAAAASMKFPPDSEYEIAEQEVLASLAPGMRRTPAGGPARKRQAALVAAV